MEPAFQLRRYAWLAKLPLSIVTNFEEFAIYDCRQKPDKNDKASNKPFGEPVEIRQWHSPSGKGK